jgi:hypothetical protein
MRLMNVSTKRLHTFYDGKVPPYAILSHTWLQDHEEVTFIQIQTPEACKHILGYRKIEFLCDQAIRDGYEWAWLDTCCIDKASSAELSEAINSMFAWYSRAEVCYVYLADVTEAGAWLESRWWTRAWTLQELLAPYTVTFYDRSWTRIGDKTDKASEIQKKTGIDLDTLALPYLMFHRSVAQRMSWAAKRHATRTEDVAYALLGIFEINMPLLYGEGSRAFLRLQQEIFRTSNDQSLFAWGFTLETLEQARKNSIDVPLEVSQYGMFASIPSQFADCGNIISYQDQYLGSEMGIVKGALHMKVPISRTFDFQPSLRSGGHHLSIYRLSPGYSIGFLPCTISSEPEYLVGIFLVQTSTNEHFVRGGLGNGKFTFLAPCWQTAETQRQSIWIRDGLFAHQQTELHQMLGEKRFTLLVVTKGIATREYSFAGALPERLEWNPDESALRLKDGHATWPDSIAVALYCGRTQHLICVRVSGDNHLSLLSDRLPENQVYRELSIFHVGGQAYNFMSKKEQAQWKVEIVSNQVFNHVIYTLTIEKNLNT